MLSTRELAPERLADLERLFAPSKVLSGCWCMWFLVTSREFEQGYGGGNRAAFADLVATTDRPLGVLAYRDGEPVGWCATGPRSRATAIEGVPLAGPGPHNPMEAYVGTETMFAGAGFVITGRPSPRRLLMRRDLEHVAGR